MDAMSRKLVEIRHFTWNGTVPCVEATYDDGYAVSQSVESWGGEAAVAAREEQATENDTQTYQGVRKLGFTIEVDSLADWQALPAGIKAKIPDYSLARLLTAPVRYFAKLPGPGWTEITIAPV